MGMLKHEHFYSAAEKCHSDMDDACHSIPEQIKRNCCEDELIALPGLQVLSPTLKHVALPSFLAMVVDLPPTFLYEAGITQQDALPLTFANPPPLSGTGTDILVRVQRFLI